MSSQPECDLDAASPDHSSHASDFNDSASEIVRRLCLVPCGLGLSHRQGAPIDEDGNYLYSQIYPEYQRRPSLQNSTLWVSLRTQRHLTRNLPSHQLHTHLRSKAVQKGHRMPLSHLPILLWGLKTHMLSMVTKHLRCASPGVCQAWNVVGSHQTLMVHMILLLTMRWVRLFSLCKYDTLNTLLATTLTICMWHHQLPSKAIHQEAMDLGRWLWHGGASSWQQYGGLRYGKFGKRDCGGASSTDCSAHKCSQSYFGPVISFWARRY